MTEYSYVRAAFINAIAEEGTKEEAVSYLQKQWNENCALRAETERLTASNAALIRERSSMIHTHRDNINRLRADLDGWKQAARQAEAERDEALAQVAALMRDRADLAQIIDNAITPNDAETHRLLLDGTYHTGPVVDWVHRVMIAMRDLLRQDPSKAQAALEAYGREMVQRASEAALAVLINDPDSQPSLAYRVERAILAATEKEADHG